MKKIVTVGSDFGSYLRWDGAVQFDWNDMMVNGGIDIFMCKSGVEDEAHGLSSIKNINSARDHNMPVVMTYPWFYPQNNPKASIDFYKRAGDREKPDGMQIDAEQYVDENGVPVPGQKISDNLQALYEGLSDAFPEILVDVYNNTDFITTRSPQCRQWFHKLKHPMKAGWPDWGLESYEITWSEFRSGKMKECLDWTAKPPRPWRWINLYDGSYEPDFSLWTGLEDNLWFWQFSSRMLPKNYLPGSLYYHQYDFFYFNGDLTTLKATLRKEKVPTENNNMAAIWDPTKSMSMRAPMLEISSDFKNVDFQALANNGTSAVIVRVAGEDGEPKPNLYSDPKAGYNLTGVANAKMAGIAEVNLRAGYYLDNQKNIGGDGKVKGILDEKPEENPIVRAVIGALRRLSWTFPSLLSSDEGWFPFSAIMFNIWDTTTKAGGDPGDVWQAATLKHAIYPISDLMNAGKFPKVPIWLLTNGGFITHYDHLDANGNIDKNQVNQLYTWLNNNRQLVRLGLTDIVYTQVPSAVPMKSVKEVWDNYRPTDSFKFGYTDNKGKRVLYTPYGWEFHYPLQGNETPIGFHYYTTDRFPIPEITDVLGKPQLLRGFLYSGSQEDLDKDLKFDRGSVIQPPVDPPVVENPPTTLEEAIDMIIKLQAYNNAVEIWLKSFPFTK